MMNTEMIFYTEIALLLSIFVFGLQWLKLELEQYFAREEESVPPMTEAQAVTVKWIRLRTQWWESYKPVVQPRFAWQGLMATA
jgi:hypothetical protein